MSFVVCGLYMLAKSLSLFMIYWFDFQCAMDARKSKRNVSVFYQGLSSSSLSLSLSNSEMFGSNRETSFTVKTLPD